MMGLGFSLKIKSGFPMVARCWKTCFVIGNVIFIYIDCCFFFWGGVCGAAMCFLILANCNLSLRFSK